MYSFKFEQGPPAASQSKFKLFIKKFTGLNLTGLSLSGLRIGPMDPKKGGAQVGVP